MSVEEVRDEVYRRDGGCVAPRIDPEAGPCYDRWGKHIISTKVGWTQGEMDYVRLGSRHPRHQDPSDHLWLCPGHHQGRGPSSGYVWATSHRKEQREYLENYYRAEAGVFT